MTKLNDSSAKNYGLEECETLYLHFYYLSD